MTKLATTSIRNDFSLIIALATAALTTFGIISTLHFRRKKDKEERKVISPEVKRLRSLLSTSKLLHPYLPPESFQSRNRTSLLNEEIANFTDLAAAFAASCGLSDTLSTSNVIREKIFNQIGGTTRKHVILILCDGMGNSLLEQHLPCDSFLRQNNITLTQESKSAAQKFSLRAVFPSTTPAALTTLVTAKWPGIHGIPGWDLREQDKCDFPGELNGTVSHIRILADKITNTRTNEPVPSGYHAASWDPIFVQPPWSRRVIQNDGSDNNCMRKMTFVNAYSHHGSGKNICEEDGQFDHEESSTNVSHSSDFSLWQMGRKTPATKEEVDYGNDISWVEAQNIGETSYHTLGKPEGSDNAINFFREGIDKVLKIVANAEKSNERSFTYLYTAHPDKHMHALGTCHAEVANVIRGIDKEIERLWSMLGTIGDPGHNSSSKGSKNNSRVDATVVVTADHGHVTVNPGDMIELPKEITDCLEYANIGVFGKGRHAYLHCRAGLQTTLRERWRSICQLNEAFVLLTIDEAVDHGLFGPDPPLTSVRPRLGDFVAVATDFRTLVSPKELETCENKCQGAHGSLLPEEMSIPFVLCSPNLHSDAKSV